MIRFSKLGYERHFAIILQLFGSRSMRLLRARVLPANLIERSSEIDRTNRLDSIALLHHATANLEGAFPRTAPP